MNIFMLPVSYLLLFHCNKACLMIEFMTFKSKVCTNLVQLQNTLHKLKVASVHLCVTHYTAYLYTDIVSLTTKDNYFLIN